MFLNDLRKLRLDLWRCHWSWECLCHIRLFLHSVATKPAAKDKELFVACCCHIRWKTRKSFVKYQQESRVMEMVKGGELTPCSDRKLSTEAAQQSICILITSPAPHYVFQKKVYYYQMFSNLWLVSAIPFNKLHTSNEFHTLFTHHSHAAWRGFVGWHASRSPRNTSTRRGATIDGSAGQGGNQWGGANCKAMDSPLVFSQVILNETCCFTTGATNKAQTSFNMWLPNWMFVSPGLTAPSSRSHPSERPTVVGFQTCFCWEMIQFSPNKSN